MSRDKDGIAFFSNTSKDNIFCEIVFFFKFICSCLPLKRRTEWPLGVLIFTPETMQTYNKIFRLLLKLRRIQLNLNGLWKNVAFLDKPVLELRWNLQHVLIHLSQYIQIDVIEVQKSIMDRQMNQCDDFDKFRAAHANFLVVVAAQTFLHVPAVIKCYNSNSMT